MSSSMTKEELIAQLAEKRDEYRRKSYEVLPLDEVLGNWYEGVMTGLNYAIGMLGLLD